MVDTASVEHLLNVRVIALSLLVLTVGMGATTYLGAQGKQADARARSHVQAAAQAAEAWYQDPFGGHGSYKRIDGRALVQEAPVVSPKIRAFSLAGGKAFCLADVEGAGHSAYFVGGDTSSLGHLGGAIPLKVTLVHSTGSDAASVCSGMS